MILRRGNPHSRSRATAPVAVLAVLALWLAFTQFRVSQVVGLAAAADAGSAAEVDTSARRLLKQFRVVGGVEVYVDTVGSDSNPGSIDRPLRTIQHAVEVAPDGSTIVVRGGTYGGFEIERSGLTIVAFDGEPVTVTDTARNDIIQFTGVTSGALRGLIVRGNPVQYGSGIKVKNSSGVTISDSTVADNQTFGIVVVSSSNVTISGNRITGNAAGIEERYAGDGVVIVGNTIHANTRMVDSGRGRQGINFYKSVGSVFVTRNVLYDNGTHFEVYGASNLSFTENVTWNGQIMETGTDGLPCDNNLFVRNLSYRGSGFQGTTTNGMILRCASNNLVAHNTIDGFDQFAFDVVDGRSGEPYGGPIDGLRIVNNIAVGGRAFSIDSALPASVDIDWNLVDNTGSTALYGNHLAYVDGLGNFDTLAAFVEATGYQAHGLVGDPRFVDRQGRDFRLTADSPAVDRATLVASQSFAGSGPDIGRYEL